MDSPSDFSGFGRFFRENRFFSAISTGFDGFGDVCWGEPGPNGEHNQEVSGLLAWQMRFGRLSDHAALSNWAISVFLVVKID